MMCVEYMGSASTRPEGDMDNQTRLDKRPQWGMLSYDFLSFCPLEPSTSKALHMTFLHKSITTWGYINLHLAT